MTAYPEAGTLSTKTDVFFWQRFLVEPPVAKHIPNPPMVKPFRLTYLAREEGGGGGGGS